MSNKLLFTLSNILYIVRMSAKPRIYKTTFKLLYNIPFIISFFYYDLPYMVFKPIYSAIKFKEKPDEQTTRYIYNHYYVAFMLITLSLLMLFNAGKVLIFATNINFISKLKYVFKIVCPICVMVFIIVDFKKLKAALNYEESEYYKASKIHIKNIALDPFDFFTVEQTVKKFKDAGINYQLLSNCEASTESDRSKVIPNIIVTENGIFVISCDSTPNDLENWEGSLTSKYIYKNGAKFFNIFLVGLNRCNYLHSLLKVKLYLDDKRGFIDFERALSSKELSASDFNMLWENRPTTIKYLEDYIYNVVIIGDNSNLKKFDVSSSPKNTFFDIGKPDIIGKIANQFEKVFSTDEVYEIAEILKDRFVEFEKCEYIDSYDEESSYAITHVYDMDHKKSVPCILRSNDDGVMFYDTDNTFRYIMRFELISPEDTVEMFNRGNFYDYIVDTSIDSEEKVARLNIEFTEALANHITNHTEFESPDLDETIKKFKSIYGKLNFQQ